MTPFADAEGGETKSTTVAVWPRLSTTVTVALPAKVEVSVETKGFELTTAELNVPKVLVKVTELAPGAFTVTTCPTPVDMVELFAGEATAIAFPAVTLNANVLALPKAVTFTLAPPTATPETDALAIPLAFVTAVTLLNANTVGSVTAKVTALFATVAPFASVTTALKFTLLPPAISELPPVLVTVNVAPLICTWRVAGLAVHEEQLAVTVASRVDSTVESATNVTMARPVVASVVTMD